MRKEAGNLLLWIVLGIVAVGLGAVIVWRYFAATDSLNNAQNSQETSVVTTKPIVAQTVKIPEWGVSFGVPASLKDKDVTVVRGASDNKPEAVYYYSSTIEKTDNTCGAGGSRYENSPFLVVSRSQQNTEGDRNLAGVTEKDVVHVGDWYYFVSTANIKDCYDSQVIAPFVSDQTRQTVVDSIKAIQ